MMFTGIMSILIDCNVHPSFGTGAKNNKNMKKYYYHLTAKENLQSILEKGLLANEEGDIFVFENCTIFNPFGCEIDYSKKTATCGVTVTTVADHICNNQIFIKEECVMFKVHYRGIERENFTEDKVGELPSYLHKQWIAKQQVIEPKWLTYEYFTPKRERMFRVEKVCDISK